MKSKRFDYFECLVKMAEFSLAEAKLLKETLQDFDEKKLQANLAEIHNLEHGCDMLKHQLTQALVKEFLPPVEREDLMELAHVCDELTDKVESTLVFFYMANITTMREDTLQFVNLVIECCELVVKLMGEFKNFKKSTALNSYIVKINDLEEQGDQIYMNAVRLLSCSSESTRTIIEWRDVYRNFEVCYDSAEKVADTIQSIIMKNA